VIIFAFYRVVSFSWPGSLVSMIYLVWVQSFFRSFLIFFLFLSFDIDLLIGFFFIWHWLIGLWALWFIQLFFLVGLSLFHISCRRLVGLTWLDSIFFRLIFYSILLFDIKLLTLKCCHCFHLSGVIPSVGWSGISSSPPRINSASSSMVAWVVIPPFVFFFFSFSPTLFSHWP
jgi:hypothetical protein